MTRDTTTKAPSAAAPPVDLTAYRTHTGRSTMSDHNDGPSDHRDGIFDMFEPTAPRAPTDLTAYRARRCARCAGADADRAALVVARADNARLRQALAARQDTPPARPAPSWWQTIAAPLLTLWERLTRRWGPWVLAGSIWLAALLTALLLGR